MTVEVITVKFTCEEGTQYLLSKHDEEGQELEDGQLMLTNVDEGTSIVLTSGIIKTLARAVNAFESGVVVD